MLESQERRHPLVALSDATLRAMVAASLPDHRITATALLSGGFSNTNYRVECADHPPVVLRIVAHDAMVCRKEADIFQLVHAAVPVPELLYSDVDGDRFGYPYSVSRWVEGVTLNAVLATGDVDAIGRCAYAAGKTLAAIARFTFPQPGFFGPDLAIQTAFGNWQESLREYVATCLFTGHAAKWLGEELTAQLWHLVTEKAGYLDVLPLGATLGHGDYKGQNLLVRQIGGAWDIAAVLDWEFAFAGTPLLDLGIFLRYERLAPPVYAQEVVRGYTEHGGALPEHWRPMIKLLDLINLCDFLNSPLQRPVLYADVITLIRATIALF